MLLDIGVGIIMAILVSKIFAVPAGIFMVSAGIVFSLLMDIDALINLFIYGGTGSSYKHRDLFHIPLLYIPIGMLVLYFYQPALSLLFGLCSLAHFIHDSIGLGWGLKWLYPFYDDQYSFLYQYNAHKAGLSPAKWGLIGKWGIYVWKSGDIDRLEEKYGDKDWFRHIYLSLHPYAIVEASVFLFALILLYFNR